MAAPDATPCTRDFASYEVLIEGRTYKLWDTPGLNEASGIGIFRRSARVDSLKRFLQERHRLRQLDLLVFCFRGGRAHRSMSRVYKIFGETTRRIAIPVVIAITHLERQQPTMDAWWQDNERRLAELGLLFDGHACVTCLPSCHRRWASQREIRDLISAEYRLRAQSMLSTQEYLMDSRSCVVC